MEKEQYYLSKMKLNNVTRVTLDVSTLIGYKVLHVLALILYNAL